MLAFLKIGSFAVPTYGLCMTLAVTLCGFLAVRKALCLGVVLEDIIIVLALSVGSFIIGGGLLYIIVSYSPKEILDYIKNRDFSFLINGGLVFYGGLIGGIAGTIAAAKFLTLDLSVVERCIVPFLPLGHAIGRVGCLLAGCCYGRAYNGMFAVENILFGGGARFFPIQVVEALFNIIIMLFLLKYSKRQRAQYKILILYLYMYSLGRFVIEFFRGDVNRGRLWLLSSSQWISVLVLLFCFGFSLYKYCGKKIYAKSNKGE